MDTLNNYDLVYTESDCREYFTKGKKYRVTKIKKTKEDGNYSFYIKDDNGTFQLCFLKKSHHLFGKDWLVKNNLQSNERKLLESTIKKVVKESLDWSIENGNQTNFNIVYKSFLKDWIKENI